MNTLITPGSGNISFSKLVTQGSDYLPPLSSSARIAYTKDGGLTIVSTASSSERFNVEGNYGNLLTINDTASGTLFSVNDISGLPLLIVSDNGSLSTNSVIYASGGNSNDWNSVYTTTQNNSATWSGSSSTYTTTRDNSANWSEAYTNLVTNSANYLSGASTFYVNANFVKLSGDTMTGGLTVVGTISSSNTITGHNIATQNQVQYFSSDIVKVYQYYNSATTSLDTIFI